MCGVASHTPCSPTFQGPQRAATQQIFASLIAPRAFTSCLLCLEETRSLHLVSGSHLASCSCSQSGSSTPESYVIMGSLSWTSPCCTFFVHSIRPADACNGIHKCAGHSKLSGHRPRKDCGSVLLSLIVRASASRSGKPWRLKYAVLESPFVVVNFLTDVAGGSPHARGGLSTPFWKALGRWHGKAHQQQHAVRRCSWGAEGP